MTIFPSHPHAVVFDMDGLLFDTEVLYLDAAMAAAREFGVEMPEAVYLRTVGLPGDASREVVCGHFGPEFDFDAFWAAADDRFAVMMETDLRLKPGAVELLDILAGAGLPRAIATSSSPRKVRHHLDAHGLTDRFDAVVARGDYTRGKPHPEPFLRAAERLGVAPELCVALEDSHNGVRAASGAGMMTIMVPDLIAPTDEIRRLCLAVAVDLHEVGTAISALQGTGRPAR